MEKIDKIIFYSPKDIATMLSIPIETVWNYIRSRKIPAIKVGKHYRVSAADFEAFLEASKLKALPAVSPLRNFKL